MDNDDAYSAYSAYSVLLKKKASGVLGNDIDNYYDRDDNMMEIVI